MRSFTLGNYRIDFVSHSRVFGENFPRPTANAVAEAFEVDCYDVSGRSPVPFDWYPNAEPHPHPERVQRQTFFWAGKQFQDVRAPFNPDTDQQITEEEAQQRRDNIDPRTGLADPLPVDYRVVDSKRGADFRARLFPSILRRIRKAEAAKLLGLVVGAVTEVDLEKTVVADPIDLRSKTLNDAVFDLTGEAARITTRIPRGTIANIDCDYDGSIHFNPPSGYTDSPTATTIPVNDDEGDQDDEYDDAYFRFPLGSLPDSITVADADQQVNVTSESIESGDDVRVYAYNSDGQADPESDSGSTKFSRCQSGSILVTLSGGTVGSTGSKTFDLGASADSLIAAANSAVSRFSTGMAPFFSGGERWELEAIENAGSDPSTLILDYTEAAGAEEVAVAGNLPAQTGTLNAKVFEDLTGSLPSQLGVLDFQLSLQRDIAGSLPSQTGVLSLLAYIGLTGNLPSQLGVVNITQDVDISGSLPAQQGALAILYHIALTGVLPAQSGVLSLLASIALQGSLPAQVGELSIGTFEDLIGSLPAQSGVLNTQVTADMSGSLPAQTGTLSLLAHIALAGNVPAMSGSLQLLAHIALTGSLPAASGAIDALYQISITGDLPAQVGVLQLLAHISLTGELPEFQGRLNLNQTASVSGILPAMSGTIPFEQLLNIIANARARKGLDLPPGRGRTTSELLPGRATNPSTPPPGRGRQRGTT